MKSLLLIKHSHLSLLPTHETMKADEEAKAAQEGAIDDVQDGTQEPDDPEVLDEELEEIDGGEEENIAWQKRTQQ